MCGRFILTTPLEALEALFEISASTNLQPRYNIAPTQEVAVVGRSQEGRREMRLFRWGLVPSWAKDIKMAAGMINARAETVREKPAFRQAFAKRRCLVPANGFYEWPAQATPAENSKDKLPRLLTLPGGQCFAFAGLWEGWRNPDGTILRSFTIVTTTAVPSLQELHHRMPVILPAEAYAAWLDPAIPLTEAHGLLQPYDRQPIDQRVVSEMVNSVRNDDERCLAPADQNPRQPSFDVAPQQAGR